MKNLFWIPLLLLSVFIYYSCSKKGVENNLLIGNWNVVNDSSLNTNTFFLLWVCDSGVSSSNYINGSNYIGEQCGATFNFNSNGNMVTSFYNCTYGYPLIDSAKYVFTGNQIAISIYAQNINCCSFTYFNPIITRTYIISNLTAHSATLTFETVHPSPLNVSGIETEIINLKK